MSPKTKKILRAINSTLLILFIVFIFVYIHMCKNDPLTNKIIKKQPVSFTLLLYGTENFMPGKLDVFLVYYERNSKLFKVLSVNSDMVVFRKKERARSFKFSFLQTAKKDSRLAITNLYVDLFETIGNNFDPDFYINIDYATLAEIFAKNKEINALIKQEDFVNRSDECVNKLELCEQITKQLNKNALGNIKKMLKYHSKVDTNLKKRTVFNMIIHFRFTANSIMFCDLPAKHTKTRVEPDKKSIMDFMTQIYYSDTLENKDKEFMGMIEVKNASQKPRMAEKVTWLLRENKFDVLDWSNSGVVYDKTIIKDYRGSFMQSLKIADILKCGKIIVSYNKNTYYNIGVFVGRDCEIYDKLDKDKK